MFFSMSDIQSRYCSGDRESRFTITALKSKKRWIGIPIISLFTEGNGEMIAVGQKSLAANGCSFSLFGIYTVYSSLLLALGKGAAGFFLGASDRESVLFPLSYSSRWCGGWTMSFTHNRLPMLLLQWSRYLWQHAFIKNWLRQRCERQK